MSAKTILSNLPQIDKVLRSEAIQSLSKSYHSNLIKEIVRKTINGLREKALHGTDISSFTSLETIVSLVEEELAALSSPSLKRVINGSGVILNTNLGRAPLSQGSADRINQISTGYSNLELDLITGKRGERTTKLEELIILLSGAEAALFVNNNAAAVFLCINALANNLEVIVSRGELIEIGGSFRLPEIIQASGGILREIGTTNRTRIKDYHQATNENSGILLKCHRSNYHIEGFVEEASIEELAQLSKECNLPFVYDLGSGSLIEMKNFKLGTEPELSTLIQEKISLLTLSSDKLIGGPQAGIIVGEKKYVQLLRKHPLYRALRLDKMTIAALESTLLSYLSSNNSDLPPALKFAAISCEELESRANKIIANIKNKVKRLKLEICKTNSAIGGGSLPDQSQESRAIQIATTDKNHNQAELIARTLRMQEIPIITTIYQNQVLLDLRAVFTEEDQLIEAALLSLDKSI